MNARGTLLDVSGLRVSFYTYRGVIKALNGVDLWMDSKQRLGVVGETGCGKSVTALAIMRLIEEPGEIQAGRVIFDGTPLLARSPGKPGTRFQPNPLETEGKRWKELTEDQMEKVRGKELSMIFQEPRSALNPVMRVGFQIAESISKARKISIREAYPQVREMLTTVGLDADRVIQMYPHELSGGMAQRVMIGMGLSTNPKLLIADEPTSALDVTIQAQILELLDHLARERGNAVLMITHDMGIVAEFCDYVMVMYAGNSTEYAATKDLFNDPLHPYTQGLLKAVPRVGRIEELQAIPGTVPDLVEPPTGCRFHPRCPKVINLCSTDQPPFHEVKPGHYVSCHLYSNPKEDQ